LRAPITSWRSLAWTFDSMYWPSGFSVMRGRNRMKKNRNIRVHEHPSQRRVCDKAVFFWVQPVAKCQRMHWYVGEELQDQIVLWVNAHFEVLCYRARSVGLGHGVLAGTPDDGLVCSTTPRQLAQHGSILKHKQLTCLCVIIDHH
jgi:hypothetical protein